VYMKSGASLGELLHPHLKYQLIEKLDLRKMVSRYIRSCWGALIEGFAFDRVFDMESQQKDIFDWGVKGIVEGELASVRGDRELITRCNDWIQWDSFLLWSNRFRKDV